VANVIASRLQNSSRAGRETHRFGTKGVANRKTFHETVSISRPTQACAKFLLDKLHPLRVRLTPKWVQQARGNFLKTVFSVKKSFLIGDESVLRELGQQ
jgi:hypothetical protein